MTSIGNISNSSSLSHPWGGPERVWNVGRYIKKRLVITWSRHIEIVRVIWTGKKKKHVSRDKFRKIPDSKREKIFALLSDITRQSFFF